MDQPGKVANPARGQLNRENGIPLSPCVLENLVSRDGFSRPVPRVNNNINTVARCFVLGVRRNTEHKFVLLYYRLTVAHS